MYISVMDNGEAQKSEVEIVEISISKPVRTLKIIYETNMEKHIVMLDKEIKKKTDDFFKNSNLNEGDKILIQMLLQSASTYKRMEKVYQNVSEELEITITAIKMKLVKIKNIMGYKYIHPDDFLKRIINNIGLPQRNTKILSI